MRIATLARACLLPPLFALGAVPANAATGGVITGTVVTGDGRAAAGDRISAFAMESAGEQRARWVSADPARKTLTTGLTDAKGNFALQVTQPLATGVGAGLLAPGTAVTVSWPANACVLLTA